MSRSTDVPGVRREIGGRGRQVRPRAETSVPTGLKAALVLSAFVAALMVVSSAAGLLIDNLYPDGDWARQAFRGGDLATLLLAVPLLTGSLVLSVRGSMGAPRVWIAMLGYSVYNYAYGVFGAEFNGLFLAHIAIFSMSLFAMALALRNLDFQSGTGLGTSRMPRWIGGFLVLVGAAQGGLWVFLVLRFAFTGQLLNDIPSEGQHLVFALDLSLLVPTLILAGVLLYRRTSAGFFMGTAVAVFGAVYQVNLMLAGVFQANADVPGVKAFPPEGVLLTLAFVTASAVLLGRRSELGR